MKQANWWDKYISKDDITVSATCLMIKDYIRALGDIKGDIGTILDLGCGYGGISLLTQSYFGAHMVYGIDEDAERVEIAGRRGLSTAQVNLNYQPIPLNDGIIDLVICNGVMEHLAFYDHAITEAYRVLKNGGHFLVTMPNLGNYIQRISLLLGFQPSDVSVSSKIQVGTIFDAGKPSVGHAHSATVRAMRQLLAYYNFHIVSIRKGRPKIVGTYRRWALPIKIMGCIVPICLVRRIIIVSRKCASW